jgi:hypothetical protein
MGAGLGIWLAAEIFIQSEVWPAQILGLIAAIAGMLAGSVLPQKIRHAPHHAAHHGRHTGGVAGDGDQDR